MPVIYSSAVRTRLQPRPPVVILTLPHVTNWNWMPAIPALLAVQLVNGQALLLDQAFCLLQTRLHAILTLCA